MTTSTQRCIFTLPGAALSNCRSQASLLYDQYKASDGIRIKEKFGIEAAKANRAEENLLTARADHAISTQSIEDDQDIRAAIKTLLEERKNTYGKIDSNYEGPKILVDVLKKLEASIDKQNNQRPPITPNQATLGAPTPVGAAEVPIGSPKLR